MTFLSLFWWWPVELVGAHSLFFFHFLFSLFQHLLQTMEEYQLYSYRDTIGGYHENIPTALFNMNPGKCTKHGWHLQNHLQARPLSCQRWHISTCELPRYLLGFTIGEWKTTALGTLKGTFVSSLTFLALPRPYLCLLQSFLSLLPSFHPNLLMT